MVKYFHNKTELHTNVHCYLKLNIIGENQIFILDEKITKDKNSICILIKCNFVNTYLKL
jgi:hypothetical protein